MDALQTQENIPETVFTDRKNHRARAWGFVFSLLLLAGLCVAAYFAWLWFSPRVAKFGLSVLWINGKVAIILLPFILLALAWLFFGNLPRKKTSVLLSTDGILRKHGNQVLKLHWDSLETLRIHLSRAFFLGIPGRRRESIALTDAVGNKMVLDARMDRFEELVNLVREKAFPTLLMLAQEQLSRAGVVSFGKQLSLRQELLQVKHKTLAKEQISFARIEKGWLKLGTNAKKKFRIRVDKLVNLDVLLFLLDKSS